MKVSFNTVSFIAPTLIILSCFTQGCGEKTKNNITAIEDAATANEGATQASLKSAIFSAQITFQAGSYQDVDRDGWGRYGFINEMTGNKATLSARKNEIKLLVGQFADNRTPALANNYYYKIYLPHGEHAAFTSGDTIDAANEDMAERTYVVYAWPKDASSGRTVFAMTEDGQVRAMPKPYDHRYNENTHPEWNLLWGGANAGWNDQPTWQQAQRRQKKSKNTQ